MKKAVKFLSLVLVMLMVMSPLALASSGFDKINTQQTNEVTEVTNNVLSSVASVVQVVGYGIAVIMVIWLGVQYVIATPSKKAELKGKLWSMAIGVVLIVGGVTILKIVADAGNSVVETLQ